MPFIRNMYHTQDYRLPYLVKPILCKQNNAWLGEGYYFWYDEDDAVIWGTDVKTKWGKFVVYVAEVDCEGILDTVFNEEHYKFFLKIMDKVADDIYKKIGQKATIKQVNDILYRNKAWQSVTGIMFQDISTNYNRAKVDKLYYRKRIQLVAFELNIVHTFTHAYEAAC